MNTTIENGTVKLSLEGELTIYTAVDTKQQLLAGLEQGDALEADISGVSEFDSAGLQIFLLAHAEALRASKKLRFTGSSAAVEEVLALCRLNDIVDSPRLHGSH